MGKAKNDLNAALAHFFTEKKVFKSYQRFPELSILRKSLDLAEQTKAFLVLTKKTFCRSKSNFLIFSTRAYLKVVVFLQGGQKQEWLFLGILAKRAWLGPFTQSALHTSKGFGLGPPTAEIWTTYKKWLMMCKKVYNQLFGRASSEVGPG